MSVYVEFQKIALSIRHMKTNIKDYFRFTKFITSSLSPVGTMVSG